MFVCMLKFREVHLRAKIIHECLDQLDLNNLEMQIIKDTFIYTIGWKYPAVQSLILSSLPKSQQTHIFTRDDG